MPRVFWLMIEVFCSKEDRPNSVIYATRGLFFSSSCDVGALQEEVFSFRRKVVILANLKEVRPHAIVGEWIS